MVENRENPAESRLVPALSLSLVIFVLILIPLRIIGYGYLPSDDALRHSAKVVSGKDWNEILVLRDDITMDSHPGWHAILGFVHGRVNCDTDGLVAFSVVFLFVLFCIIPALSLPRPEAWLITLLVVLLANLTFIIRLLLGRPYIFSMAVVVILCFLWPHLRNKKIPYKIMLILTLLFAASTWIHCSWHLFALPVLCFFLAREWRVSFRIMACAILGIALGALLTGHPYIFLQQTLLHTIRAFSSHQLQRMLVSEFQPFTGNSMMVIAITLMIGWRYMRGAWSRKSIDNPVFILAISGWVLGFVSVRFWLDWGMPAACVWMGREFCDVLENKIDFFSWRRFLLTLAVAGTLYVGITNDVNSRWTWNLTKEYLSAHDPEQKEWLPEAGGIIYSDDMRIFYYTFYKNPHAPWRYILGFEPTLMPEEDLEILRNIQWNFGAGKAFQPWVKKMQTEDRLILRGGKKTPPDIPGLEWHYAATGIWVGRLPKND